MIARILSWVAARLMPKPDVHVLDEREFVIPDIPLRFYHHKGHHGAVKVGGLHTNGDGMNSEMDVDEEDRDA